MNFAPLIERALAAAGRDLSLPELLELVDRLDRSVPTLEELNGGLQSLGRPPVTEESYHQAVSENHQRLVRHLADGGISPERQREILQRYAALMVKP
jgi:hypothetical protein